MYLLKCISGSPYTASSKIQCFNTFGSLLFKRSHSLCLILPLFLFSLILCKLLSGNTFRIAKAKHFSNYKTAQGHVMISMDSATYECIHKGESIYNKTRSLNSSDPHKTNFDGIIPLLTVLQNFQRKRKYLLITLQQQLIS